MNNEIIRRFIKIYLNSEIMDHIISWYNSLS